MKQETTDMQRAALAYEYLENAATWLSKIEDRPMRSRLTTCCAILLNSIDMTDSLEQGIALAEESFEEMLRVQES